MRNKIHLNFFYFYFSKDDPFNINFTKMKPGCPVAPAGKETDVSKLVNKIYKETYPMLEDTILMRPSTFATKRRIQSIKMVSVNIFLCFSST